MIACWILFSDRLTVVGKYLSLDMFLIVIEKSPVKKKFNERINRLLMNQSQENEINRV